MDYVEQIIQCYQYLSSSTNVEQANKILTDFYDQHKAFPVLISILHSDHNEIIKQHAAIGLQITLKRRWDDEADKEEILKSIFFLLMTNNSISVSKHLIELIVYLNTTDESVNEMIISFVNQCVGDEENDPSFNYPMAIYSSLCLLDKCIESIGVESTLALYQKVISDGFEINEAPIQIAATSLTFNLTHICEDDLGFGPVFPQSLALMQSLSGNPLIHEILNVFSIASSHPCPIMNIQLLIQQLLFIINNENSPYVERTHAFHTLCDVLESYSEEIFLEEEKSNSGIITNSIGDYAGSIFEATTTLTSLLFQEEDAYEMSPYDIIQPIAEIFSEFDDLLESFWEQIPDLQQYSFGQFFIIVFIRYSIDDSIEFYSSKISDVASFLCNVASDSQSPCLVEAAVDTLCEFSITFYMDITDLKSMILDAVFGALEAETSPEMIIKFKKLVNSIGDSDSIISKASEYLINIVTDDQVENSLKIQILWCIAELIKKSEQGVEPIFQDLFDLFKEIFESEDQNELKSASIYCLANLCKKCPSLFEPFAEDFAKYIVSAVSEVVAVISEEPTEDEIELNFDPEIIIQSINAYCYIIENVLESTGSTIEDMVEMLTQICDKFVPNIPYYITIQDTALRVFCISAAKYPQILQNCIQQLLSFIKNRISFDAAVGTSWISSAIASLQNKTEILPQLTNIIIDMIEKSNKCKITAMCFESLSFLIEWCGAVVVDEAVLEWAGKAFTYDLFCFKKEKYNDGVHKNAQNVFRQAINALQDTAFQTLQNTEFQSMKDTGIQNYVDLFFSIAESKTKPMRDLGLQLLADLVGETPEGQIPNQMLEKILEIAEKEASEGNYIGFYAIKKLSSGDTSNAEAIKSLIPMMVQRLFSNSEYAPEIDPSHMVESTMIANDNCVSALGAILMNIFGDELIESFNIFEVDENDPVVEGLNIPVLFVILRAMPPKIDISENESIFEFFLWLFEKADGEFAEQFAEVLVKLFTDPIETLKENLLTEGTIEKLNEILVQLVQSCGGEQFCSSVLDGDEEKLEILNSYLSQQ